MVSRKLNFQKRKNKPKYRNTRKYGGAFQPSSRKYKVNDNFILALIDQQYRFINKKNSFEQNYLYIFDEDFTIEDYERLWKFAWDYGWWESLEIVYNNEDIYHTVDDNTIKLSTKIRTPLIIEIDRIKSTKNKPKIINPTSGHEWYKKMDINSIIIAMTVHMLELLPIIRGYIDSILKGPTPTTEVSGDVISDKAFNILRKQKRIMDFNDEQMFAELENEKSKHQEVNHSAENIYESTNQAALFERQNQADFFKPQHQVEVVTLPNNRRNTLSKRYKQFKGFVSNKTQKLKNYLTSPWRRSNSEHLNIGEPVETTNENGTRHITL